MLLAVDVRNTTTVLGVFTGSGDHATLTVQRRFRTDPAVTADEIALTFRGLLGPDVENITAVAALSTVPSVLREMRVMLSRYWSHVPQVVVEPGVRTGVPLLVDNPKEVGADRIVNCLAAYEKFRSPCVVVDFGTSTCVDVVSGKGEFLGGVIAPGLEISMDALASRSAALRTVELVSPRHVLGKNTVEAMQAGAVIGFAGLVDGLVARIRTEVAGFGGAGVVVVATGDSASLVAPESTAIDRVEPTLTLDGLQLVHERNRARRRP
ncbi:type III pantothenate kinase [Rhodococcoides corynebacterioides]|uniref:Type III pantothenate kinase n=1 Tax=Rhodococcoides corynebacterioides TaxID=53972 RepID=A0ABS7P357_9NOCA|nr:type III pantothenate kinase [Rhodococcus corynebacterioides]MBY6366840.1 type III pantothenate kinase [Rhodococcus corynebacterioides]MBY6409123.1 type III pantothenate kinase [Rhodococcus corynebacterioides]